MKLMKRMFSFVAILSLVSGLAYAYTDDGNVNVKREMQGAPASVAYREYQLVRWAENGPSPTGGNLSAGDVVVGDCVSDDGITIAIVGSTNSVDAVRGVVVSPSIQSCDTTGTTAITDFGRRNWGYIQVRGLCTKVNTYAGGVAGSSLVAAAQVRCATASAGAPGQRTLGFSYDASGAGVANEADIEI